MLSLYILTEIVFLIFILIGINKIDNNIILNILKLLPILTNLVFSLSKKIDIKLRMVLIITVIADYIFYFLDNCLIGMYIFVLIQLLIYIYLYKTNYKLLITIGLLDIILIIIFKDKALYINAIFYFLLSLINIIKSYKLSKKESNIKVLTYSLILLLLCDICIGINYLTNNSYLLVSILEWLFYIPSQVVLTIYALRINDSFLYRLLQPIFGLLFDVVYKPTVINKEYIPLEGKCVIAGNHKHALDPILVDYCTSRVVHTLAKKELHDSQFGWFFKAIGTIPVDLHANHNKDALNSAIDYLNEGYLINLSPEGKRNFTKEVLLPFKYGAVVMAKRTNSLIVPYSITGDYKFRSKNLKIVFGKPLDISKLDIEEANQKLYNTIKKLILDNRE